MRWRWGAPVVKAHCRGEALLCRAAEDWGDAFASKTRRNGLPGIPPPAEAHATSRSLHRQHPPPPLQSFPCQHAAALHVAGMRAVLEARAPRRATRQATHRAQEAPGGVPTDDGMDQTAPAPAGRRVLPAGEPPVTGPRPRRRSARQRPLPAPLFRARSARSVPRAPSARGTRQRFPWEPCTPGWERRGRARPRITEVKQRRVWA